MPFQNYYQFLGLPNFASAEEVKQAYRKLARLYHPDVSRLDPKEAELKMKQINVAYDVLGNPAAKADFDALLRYRLNPPPTYQQQYQPPGFPPPPQGGYYRRPNTQRQGRRSWNPGLGTIILVIIAFNYINRGCNRQEADFNKVDLEQLMRDNPEMMHVVDSINNSRREANPE